VVEDKKYDAAWKTGPEYQFIDDVGFPDKLEPWQLAGANYAMHVATTRSSSSRWASGTTRGSS